MQEAAPPLFEVGSGETTFGFHLRLCFPVLQIVHLNKVSPLSTSQIWDFYSYHFTDEETELWKLAKVNQLETSSVEF